MLKRLLSLATALLGLALITSSADAQRRDRDRDADGRWELLGTQSVGLDAERDTIELGRDEGRFSAIRLQVARADIRVRSIRIVYANGYAETLDVNADIVAGERTRPIDLRGERAFLRRIEIVYRALNRGTRRQAVVDVYGLQVSERREIERPVARDAGRDGWDLLGVQTVGFGADRDVIRVGRSEGRFSALQLRVGRNDIYLNEIRINYENGYSERLVIGAEVRAGERTPPIDLRGERSFIREIELGYRSRPSFRGEAVVEVYGLHGGGVRGAAPVYESRPPVRPQWVLLGEKAAEFKADHDVIPVGRQEGRFSRLRLKVLNRDVDVLDMRVVYANGEVDTLPIRRTVRDEEEGPILDLRGERRSIREIHMTYRTRIGLGKSVVQVWGLQ